MVSTGIYNFALDKGSSFSLQIEVRDSGNALVNLTGYSGAGGIKYRFASGYLAEFGVSFNLSNTGIVDVSIPWTGTTGTPVGRMVHEVELMSGTYRAKILKGFCDINPEITL